MTIRLSMPEVTELKPCITVIGVGGAGGNAVNNMIGAQLEGVDFVAANTDAQALGHSSAERRIQLGVNATQGLGAGSTPEVGREAAMESLDEIMDHVQNSHMVFITAGMGGGTGTGAAPVIAKSTRERGVLTVGVVTKPFSFEGSRRMEIAEAGIEELQGYVDTLIIIPNQNLFRVASEGTTFAEAFRMADDVLSQGVRGVTDLMVMPGLINLDFADVRAVMREMGKAMMGTGEAEGENRSISAAEAAISNPLLEDVSMKGATGLLINITGGPDMTLMEVDEAAGRVRAEVDTNASIIFGTSLDPELEGRVRVSIIATGIESEAVASPSPLPRLQVVGGVQAAVPAIQPARAEAGRVEAPPPLTIPERSVPGTSAVQRTAPRRTSEPAAADEASVSASPPDTAARAAEAEAVMEADGGASASEPSERREEVRSDADRAVAAAPPDMAPRAPQTGAPSSAADADAAPREAPRAPQVGAPSPDDAFIPPKPVEARSHAPRMEKPEPFAAAAMTNGPPMSSGRAGSPSLLERMTGTGRARKTKETADAPPAAAGAPGARRPETAKADSSPAPAAERPVLTRVEASDRLAPPRPDEDLLDIPTFLRRPAN